MISRVRVWRLLLWLYLALLLLSNAFRLLYPADSVVAADQRSVELPVIGGSASAGPVRLAYRELGPESAPPLLLIHGTPVAGVAVMPLARELAATHRVIVPDLPGFGGSTRWLPDYSFAAHAGYLRALLDELAIDAAHIVAYSQGGGVALSLVAQDPQRVRSIAMVAAIGVQELELLGQYSLNQALYRMQQGLLQAVAWLTPHFGYLDTAVLNTAYGRNLLDSDQRPLRAALQAIEAPVILLHGRGDGFVPYEAALEHSRLLPQGRLVTLDGGHLLPITHPALMAAPIAGFLGQVEAGTAARRSDAPADRLAEAEEPFDWAAVSAFSGLRLGVVLMLLALATLISEDLTCISAGLMVAQGTIEFGAAVAACLLGIYCGDMLLFLLGRLLGPALIERGRSTWLVDASRLEKARQWFQRRGGVVIFVSRFVPGTRLPSYLVAGALRMPILHFSLFFLAAAALWTPLLVGVAYLTGANALAAIDDYQRYGLPLLLVVAAALWLAVRALTSLLSARASGTDAAEPASQDAFMEEIDRAKRSLCERYGIDASKVRVAAMGGRHGGLGNAIPLPLPFRRRYLLRYHRCMRDAEPLAIRGLFAHEMMHVLQYSQASYGELLRFMLRYALSLISVDRGSGRGRRWLRGIEHLTDLMAVEMGEGVAIAAWKRYKDQAIAGGLISDSWHSLYLSAAEIEMLESQSQQRKTRIRETLEAIGASDPWRPMRSAGV